MSKKFTLTLVVAIFLAGTGTYVGKSLVSSKADLKNKLRVLNEVIHHVSKLYIDPVDWNDAFNSAYQGMLQSLDPHSTYIDAESVKKINEQFDAKFDGIGIEFDILDGYITVITPIAGSPSDKLGIMSGDRIIEIEGKSAYQITQEEVFEKLRGPRGSTVNVSIARSEEEDLLHFKIVRDEIPIYSVLAAFMLDDSTGYIYATRFAKTTTDEINHAVQKLHKKGMHRLILDLRNNGGGLLDQAWRVTDLFIAGGDTIVYTRVKDGSVDEVYKSRNFQEPYQIPLVVLVNRASASASEIVSGALQDLDRALVVGETTFGKGLVQRQISLSDGGFLRLTVARYYTPSGRLIQRPYENGVPDYYASFGNENRDSLLTENLKNRPRYQTKSGRTVYGGGGITPDVILPLADKLQRTTVKIRSHSKRLIFNYAFDISSDLKNVDSTMFFTQFTISDAQLEQFKNYVTDKTDILIDADEFERDSEYLRNQIKAEIANTLFPQMGKSAGYKVRATIDNQIQEAIAVFPRTKELKF